MLKLSKRCVGDFMEIFIEQIVKKSDGTNEMMKKVGVGALTAFGLFVTILLFPILREMGLLAMAGVIYGGYLLITALNVEYEYILTNDELDIDAIIARRKRKRLVNIKLKSVDDFKLYNRANFSKDKTGKFIDASAGEKSELKQYVFDYNSQKSGKVQVIISPDERTLKAIRTYLPRAIKRND
jgi:hypothetical protein